MKSITAIILAGGVGERLRPLTLHTPKPLLPIKRVPILEHALNNFKKYGITNIVLAVGYKSEKIKEYFGNGKKFGVNIKYSYGNRPLGTGGAIKKAARGIKGEFIVINGDNLADFDWKAMLEFHKKHKAKITLALHPVEDVTHYGIAELKGDKIVRFIEKPKVHEAPSNLNNAGAYIIEHEALDILPKGKSSIERDCFENLCPKGVVYGFLHQGQWYPTDDIQRYTLAEKKFKIKLK